MTDKKEHIRHDMKSTAPADCVTEIRIGNSVLVVSGFFKHVLSTVPCQSSFWLSHSEICSLAQSLSVPRSRSSSIL